MIIKDLIKSVLSRRGFVDFAMVKGKNSENLLLIEIMPSEFNGEYILEISRFDNFERLAGYADSWQLFEPAIKKKQEGVVFANVPLKNYWESFLDDFDEELGLGDELDYFALNRIVDGNPLPLTSTELKNVLSEFLMNAIESGVEEPVVRIALNDGTFIKIKKKYEKESESGEFLISLRFYDGMFFQKVYESVLNDLEDVVDNRQLEETLEYVLDFVDGFSKKIGDVSVKNIEFEW